MDVLQFAEVQMTWVRVASDMDHLPLWSFLSYLSLMLSASDYAVPSSGSARRYKRKYRCCSAVRKYKMVNRFKV